MKKNTPPLNDDMVPGDLTGDAFSVRTPDMLSDMSTDALPEDINALLHQYAHCTVSDHFLDDTLSRFDTACALAASRKWNWLAFAAAIGIILSVAASALWLVVFNFTLVSKAVAAMTRVCILILQFILEMWSQMPTLGTGLMLSLCIIIFVCAAVLVKAFHETTVPHTTSG